MPRKKDLKGINRVVRVLFKHGLGDFIKEAGLTWSLPLMDRFKPVKKAKSWI